MCLDSEAEMDIPSLKKMLEQTKLERIEIFSGQTVDKPIVAKSVYISGGHIEAMVLARVITISNSDAVIKEGGMLVCGRLFHDFSHRVDGGKIFSGEEFSKPGVNCCNYNSISSCGKFTILGEG